MLFAWHLPVPPYVRQRGNKLDITLLLQGSDLPQQVFLRCEPDNEEWLLTMTAREAGEYVSYHGALPLTEGEPLRRYCFKMLWADRQLWCGPRGLQVIPPPQTEQFALELPGSQPEWAADQVFYQIFPDRFARGEGKAPLAAGEDYLAWEAPLKAKQGSSAFYGGDLDGICARLPYLQRLGVTALYLNPVFTAPSNHKYDTEDYYNVDPRFGGNDALLRLREATRAAGMRLILDGVFNHTGETHPWFDRAGRGKDGAFHHPDSPHRERFTFLPDGRVLDWKGNAHLPKLDFASQRVVDSIYRGPDSVTRYWLRPPYSIDGWRLDVIHMLGEGGSARGNLTHLAGIYRSIREENPQAYVLGEHFGDARRWLQAGVEDAAMNYMGFALPVRAFLAGVDVAYQPAQLSAGQCAEWMESYRAGLSHSQQLVMFNQLDSHDTARMLTLLNHNTRRMKMALVWLFTWIGIPCLYYGDEIGLDGENDPFCRKTFPWDEQRWDAGLFDVSRKMAALRRESVALRRGGCQVIYCRGETLVFVRTYEHETWLVALQRERTGECVLPLTPLLPSGAWICQEGEGVLTGEADYLALSLPAESATVWRISAQG
ncbi:maltodextrin glucosidase [Enterobacillus tribolii]|uniref:Alpha-glucosidase n=1 Tax=Enterobacillus tribolii TaxID=1487935 RepID=A0A370QNC1_9GAMM|nr:maltodextrin glucosidase [Enterobacillus tribolii]MBW7982107.1 maltodextrin glucosidase [Enterobacillus tribolii]RDK89871.1 alpha-glucosidase [Enterobacillus tribolii]